MAEQLNDWNGGPGTDLNNSNRGATLIVNYDGDRLVFDFIVDNLYKWNYESGGRSYSMYTDINPMVPIGFGSFLTDRKGYGNYEGIWTYRNDSERVGYERLGHSELIDWIRDAYNRNRPGSVPDGRAWFREDGRPGPVNNLYDLVTKMSPGASSAYNSLSDNYRYATNIVVRSTCMSSVEYSVDRGSTQFKVLKDDEWMDWDPDGDFGTTNALTLDSRMSDMQYVNGEIRRAKRTNEWFSEPLALVSLTHGEYNYDPTSSRSRYDYFNLYSDYNPRILPEGDSLTYGFITELDVYATQLVNNDRNVGGYHVGEKYRFATIRICVKNIPWYGYDSLSISSADPYLTDLVSRYNGANKSDIEVSPSEGETFTVYEGTVSESVHLGELIPPNSIDEFSDEVLDESALGHTVMALAAYRKTAGGSLVRVRGITLQYADQDSDSVRNPVDIRYFHPANLRMNINPARGSVPITKDEDPDEDMFVFIQYILVYHDRNGEFGDYNLNPNYYCLKFKFRCVEAEGIGEDLLDINLTWRLTYRTGELTFDSINKSQPAVIPGYGDSESDRPKWNNSLERIRSVNIKYGITGIGRQAFGSTTVKTVSIPSSVKTLGSGVFIGCGNLDYIELNGPIYVGEGGFNGCTNLSTIRIKGDGVLTLGATNLFTNSSFPTTGAIIVDSWYLKFIYRITGCLSNAVLNDHIYAPGSSVALRSGSGWNNGSTAHHVMHLRRKVGNNVVWDDGSDGGTHNAVFIRTSKFKGGRYVQFTNEIRGDPFVTTVTRDGTAIPSSDWVVARYASSTGDIGSYVAVTNNAVLQGGTFRVSGKYAEDMTQYSGVVISETGDSSTDTEWVGNDLMLHPRAPATSTDQSGEAHE